MSLFCQMSLKKRDSQAGLFMLLISWSPGGLYFLDCRKCEAMQTKAPTEGVYHGYRWAHRCQVCV